MKTYRVKVATNQRKETFSISGECINIAVKEKPLQGAANKRIVALIALHLGVAQKNVRILRGHHAESKLVSVGTR